MPTVITMAHTALNGYQTIIQDKNYINIFLIIMKQTKTEQTPQLQKRKLIGRATDFFEDDIEALNQISLETGITRAALIRQGCALIIAQYKNK